MGRILPPRARGAPVGAGGAMLLRPGVHDASFAVAAGGAARRFSGGRAPFFCLALVPLFVLSGF